MGRVFFLGLLSMVSVASLARPWIGVACAYLLALLTPQAVWYWNFEGIRPVYWVLLPTAVGFAIALVKGRYDLSILTNRRNLLLFLLWMCLTLSYFVGPYVDDLGPYRFTDPAWAMGIFHKIFVLYFIAVICMNDETKLKALIYVFVVSAGYLTYWANDQYLSGNVFGRLPGPRDLSGSGTYADENLFAMLFVIAQPFFWYLGQASQNRIWRWGLWLVIPFCWHAVFLTASRGGLVGIAATILIMAIRSKKKMLGLLLLPAFALAYHWQAGDLMKSRAETIDEFRTETSAASRLEAWSTATAMVIDNPLTGVGLASFGPAFPDYSDKQPREAHNTFFQLAAESGILAGAVYVLLILTCIVALWRNGNRLRRAQENSGTSFLYVANESTLIGLCGLVACGLFLSLQMFEIFYFLCLLTNVILYISAREKVRGAQDRAIEGIPVRAYS